MGDKDKEQLQNELMELRKKITELELIKANQKQTEKKLTKSKELYRLIAENTGDVITLHNFNLQATFTYISPSMKDVSGYESEELLGKSPFEFIHPDDKKKLFPKLKNYINAKVKKLFTGKELTASRRIELRFKDKNGNWRYVQSTGNILGNQLLFITRDITDQKKVEEALRIRQQEFASLFGSSPEALVYTDERSNILDVNPRFTELFGYTLEEIKGRNLDDGMIHPPDKIEEGKELSRIAKSRGHFKYETIRKKKDGTLFPVSISGSNITIDSQLKGMLVIYIDTTERKNMLDKLRKSEERYRNLFQNMPGAYYRTDREGNLIMINPEGVKLFGYDSLEDILGKNIAQYFYFAPEERKKYLKELEKNKGNLKDFELTLKKKVGTPLVISDTSHFYYDKDGNITGVEGIFVDITERKQNETMQKVLYNISKAANSPISLNQLYKTIHKELGTIIDTTNFYIALVDEKEDKVYFPYHQDEMDDNFPILNFSASNTLTTYVIKTGKPLLSDNSQYKEMINQEILSPKGSTTPQSIWLGVPLKIEDRVIGAMAVQSYTNSELYTEKDIKLLEFVSSQVATVIERKSSEERIKHLSFHDSLTGLYNRAYFEEELERYNFPRYYPLSIVMLDVNGLKVINDTFGHSEGDRLLQHLSQVLTSVSRQGDILARIGGDEFAILLPSTTSEQAHEFCERIKKACQQDKIKPIYLRPNISLGHTTQEGEYKDINTLLKEADKKMYQDKLFNGKSREKHFLEAFRIILAERDPHTHLHAHRLQELALSLGERVGLTEYQLGNLKLLALLHDIGKIGIPDSILFKTYILIPSEWEKMKEHSRIGYRMAKNIPDFAPIAQEILYHHEHWDGNGYPDGLKGEKIPLLSRIISIVDAYDVMQSRRPYKGAVSKTEALKEIKRCAGTQFDPQLVEIFLKIVKNKASRERKEPDKEPLSGAK
ncbi:PAS domain S-box protein [bacterium]|nr:PAS domain S-box protein [bacterium]MBU4361397.1 PAS domain S-box protein [bacterium]MBU4601503.1 PAS domain S-box protein [bacterium]MCG2762618.1 PAS domain S-box protein [Candidatus Atribacteria bacterium]